MKNLQDGGANCIMFCNKNDRLSSIEVIQKVKGKVKDVPVFINTTGLNMENAKELLKVADDAIVGSSLKKEGVTWNPADKERIIPKLKKFFNNKELIAIDI